ncbi:MAG: methyl-accepting chemotaxis protein [Defluviitaleaceae bacterium]|nr:methyl-accepting chemotaxis protein [Defluviitaleaceae bacterium]
MLRNTKVAGKLGIGFGILLIIMLAMAIYGVVTVTRINSDYRYAASHPTARYNLLLQTEIEVHRLRTNVALIAASADHPQVIEDAYASVVASREVIYELLEKYRESLRDDPRIDEETREAGINAAYGLQNNHLNNYFNTIVYPLYAVATGASDRLLPEILEEATPILAGIDNVFIALTNAAQETVDGLFTSASLFAGISSGIMLAVAIIGIAFGVIIAFVISSAITRPIKRTVDALNNVSAGNLNININRAKIGKDEVGMLTTDVIKLVDVIKSIMDDLTMAHDQFLEVGDLKFTIDESKYNNSYKEVVRLVNTILKQTSTDVLSISDILNHVSDGDFNVKLEDAIWVGDWAALPQAMNRCTNNLKDVVAEVNGMVDAAAVKGDLAYHIDASKYLGDWNKILNGLNDICHATDVPIVEIRDVLSVLNKGLFDARVTGDYAGDFLSMKNDLNYFIEDTSKYMAEINNVLGEIASGDLRKTIDMDFVGEYIVTKEAVNHISTTLRKTMAEISSASGQVLSGAKQISTSAIDLAQGAQTQASSVEELNASVDIINQQTSQNAENASNANTLSNTSNANAQAGNNAMNEMVEAMAQIKESSNNISKIIKTIQDIAFQTNLLSLNASVEAARAGEHGKGFGVVADEVRTLASRSQEAVKETEAMILASISRVDVGSGIAQTTSEALNIIVSNATEVMEIINSIAEASKEQADAVGQVGQGLQQISQVVQNNSAVSEETAAASQELTSQAELLQQLVSYFKV